MFKHLYLFAALQRKIAYETGNLLGNIHVVFIVAVNHLNAIVKPIFLSLLFLAHTPPNPESEVVMVGGMEKATLSCGGVYPQGS